MIIMTHPKTKGTIQVRESAVKVYERSGWTVDDKATKAAQEDEARRTGIRPEGAPATDKDTGEAGPQARSSARKDKEESK